MHGLSLPAPIGAAGRVQLPIAARCGFSSTFRPVNLPNVRRGATQDSRRRRRRRVWLQLAGHGGVVGQPWVILRAGGHRRGLVGRRGLVDQRGLVGVGAGQARQATPATTAGKRARS